MDHAREVSAAAGGAAEPSDAFAHCVSLDPPIPRAIIAGRKGLSSIRMRTLCSFRTGRGTGADESTTGAR